MRLKDIMIDPFKEGEWIIGILVWIISFIIVGGSMWLLVWLLDSSFLPVNHKDGIVKELHYIPEHSKTTFIMSGKNMIPITNHYNEHFEITIEIDESIDNISISEYAWNRINIGDKLCCEYTKGRISNDLYINSICE